MEAREKVRKIGEGWVKQVSQFLSIENFINSWSSTNQLFENNEDYSFLHRLKMSTIKIPVQEETNPSYNLGLSNNLLSQYGIIYQILI